MQIVWYILDAPGRTENLRNVLRNKADRDEEIFVSSFAGSVESPKADVQHGEIQRLSTQLKFST